MDCKTASILMMEYIDGEIKELDKIELFKHLESCKDCNEAFLLLSESIDMIESMDEIEPPENIETLVMSSIDVTKYNVKVRIKKSIIISSILVVFMILGGYLFNIILNNSLSLKELLIVNIVKLVNFTVLTLPNILAFIEQNLALVLSGTFIILSGLFASTLFIAVAEVYLFKKFKFNFRRS